MFSKKNCFLNIGLLLMLVTIIGCDETETTNDGDTNVEIVIDDPTVGQIGDIFRWKYKAYLTVSSATAHFYIYGNYPNNYCVAKDIEQTIGSSNIYYGCSIETELFASGCNLNDRHYDIQLVVNDDGVTRSSEIKHFTIGNPTSVSQGDLLVSRARELLSGCPNFYEPPSAMNNNVATIKNNSGSVSWSPTPVNLRNSFTAPGENETKNHYIQKLNNASFSFQLNWFSYACGYSTSDFTKGFPYPYSDDDYFEFFGASSFVTCSSGFICYGFVWAAAKEAQFSLPYDFRGGSGSGDPYEKLLQYTHIDSTNRKAGDVVIYKTNTAINADYDHVAIISQVNTSNMKLDKVISSYGFSEEFHWGAKETKLWDFHSKRVLPKGLFTSELDGGKWPDARDHWTLANVIIIRLN